jgi:dipeptidyl aminopeptidase/acylaminoacyl peptidase
MKRGKAKTAKRRRPTVKDMLKLPIHYRPAISPDAKTVAYTRLALDLTKPITVAPCYIHDLDSQSTVHALEAASEMRWLDDHTMAYITHSVSGNPRWSDIFLVTDGVGEGRRTVSHSARIDSFAPFGKGVVFQSNKSVEKKRIGNYVHVEREPSTSAVYYVSSDRALQNQELTAHHFEEESFTPPPDRFEISQLLDVGLHVTSFTVSPPTSTVYLNCQRGVDAINRWDTACFKVEMDPEAVLDAAQETSVEEAVSGLALQRVWLPDGFTIDAASPDGKTLLVSGPVRDHIKEPRSDLWLVSDTEACEQDETSDHYAPLRIITDRIDRYILQSHWVKSGIYAVHWNGSTAVISQLFEDGDFKTFDLGAVSPETPVHMTDSGHITFTGGAPNALSEIYAGIHNGDGWDLIRVTRNTEEFSHLDFGTVESIRWTSQNGTEIEGILRKPSDFDPSKKYPLILFPHGGPRGVSPLALESNDYMRPAHPLLARGILILEPNYRGSLGRGKAFMELNHNNLGVGDMWDLESGIDHLVAQGFVDETKVGSMGGSQGGYLSAYIGMHTDRCVAVSVNAGVSSWYLYYISSDMRHSIHLDGTPFDEEAREAYRKSAPIAAIHRAKTPMLIQHGEEDERISVLSAHELHRALKHKGVPVELFTLPGKGHGYLSPRENYAVMLQNYRWFCHYLLGDDLDLLKDDLTTEEQGTAVVGFRT